MLNYNIKMVALLVGAITFAALMGCDTTDAATMRRAPANDGISHWDMPNVQLAPRDWDLEDTRPVTSIELAELPEFTPVTDPEDERLLETVYVPSDYDPANTYPLVVFLHAYGWDANELAEDIYELDEQVDEMDFILLVPQGLVDDAGNTFWSANDTCCDAYDKGQDDHQYLEGLINEYREQYNVSRTYVYGSSNGAFMAHAFACQHADLVSGIITISGTDELDAATCQPIQPISVLQVHGTADTTISYEGNTFEGEDIPEPLLNGYPSAITTTTNWATRNGCNSEPTEIGTLNLDWLLPGNETTRYAWNNCQDNVDVEHWAVAGGTHTFYVWDIGYVETDGFAVQTLDWLLAQ